MPPIGPLENSANAIGAFGRDLRYGLRSLTTTCTLDKQIELPIVNDRIIATLSTAFGLLATALAVIGLYGVVPNDPLTIVTAAIALGLVALAAGYIPARRATRVHPVRALKYE